MCVGAQWTRETNKMDNIGVRPDTDTSKSHGNVSIFGLLSMEKATSRKDVVALKLLFVCGHLVSSLPLA